MHPELLRALAQARHEDLLHERRSRGQPFLRSRDGSRLFPRSRRRMGALLISVGTRLSGDGRAALELSHE
jgi:hypothetical protein